MCLLSAAKLIAYHSGIQYMSTLSIAEEQLLLYVDFPENSQKVKWLLSFPSHYHGVYWPGELLWDAHFQEFKGWHMLFLLKSMIISLGFPIPRSWLLAEHHADNCPTLSLSIYLYLVSSPLEMTLTTVVSSANFMIRLGGWERVQSCVKWIQKWTQHTAVGRPSAVCESGRETGAKSHRLLAVEEETHYSQVV